jgi:hypothetical protein
MMRRLVYVAGSPLIPIVILWRVIPGLSRSIRGSRFHWATFPLLVSGLFMHAAGELLAYIGGPTAAAERGMHHCELHRLAYVGPHEGNES